VVLERNGALGWHIVFCWCVSILINSSPSSFFGSSCGVRQGDPMSSFLFIIVMKDLSRMIFATIHHGSLLDFSMESGLFETVNISCYLRMKHWFFVGLILTIFAPCECCSFVSKLFLV
jgi:hypothetical protein